MNDKKLMDRAADNIRILAVSMVEKAKSGHPGGAMGGSDFINVLFSEFLVYDPDQPEWAGRDRFYLDPGHMSPMLYAALTLQRKFTVDDIKQFRQWGSVTPGHPERDLAHGIENSSGPLGQGHAYAAGAAVAEKFLEARLGHTMMQHKIYAYISDGGVQEGVSAEVGRLAGALGLNNLIMFYDANDIQLSTECGAVMDEDTAMKYRAWGWNVMNIDGNDPDAIREALAAANREENRPTLIIGDTVMAKGARQADGSSYEHSIKTHGAPLGGDAYINTVKTSAAIPTTRSESSLKYSSSTMTVQPNSGKSWLNAMLRRPAGKRRIRRKRHRCTSGSPARHRRSTGAVLCRSVTSRHATDRQPASACWQNRCRT